MNKLATWKSVPVTDINHNIAYRMSVSIHGDSLTFMNNENDKGGN